MKKVIRLTAVDRNRLEKLAGRLELDRHDAARRLLIAALDALEVEEKITWPLFLEQPD